MQGYHTHVEMYRDTNDRRNIQKKWARCQKKMGAVINHLPKQKKGRTTVEQETYNEVHNKKQRKCTYWYDWSTNTNTGIEMTRKKQGEKQGKGRINRDGQQEEKKVCLRNNDKKHWIGIHDWSNTHAATKNREKEIGCCDGETTMVSNGKHALSIIEKWAY
jgi:hypothetical protein